jgi:hypothetical protein
VLTVYAPGVSVDVLDGAPSQPVIEPGSGALTVYAPGISVEVASTDENVILTGSVGTTGQQFRGPADRAKKSVLEAAIAETPKWSVFADEFEHISPSRNGVRATNYVKLHPWGNMNGLYRQIPTIDQGMIYPPLIADFEEIVRQQFEKLVPHRPGYTMKSGPRGVNVMNPYTTWHGHTRIKDDGTISMSPHIPMWIGIMFDGTVTFAMRDGSVYNPFKIPNVRGTSDFTFSEVDRKIFYVVSSLTGEVIKIDRHPAIDANGHEDFSLWQTSVLASPPAFAKSMVCCMSWTTATMLKAAGRFIRSPTRASKRSCGI